MAGIYDRSELLDEPRAALASWSASLDRLVSEREAADVLPMVR